MQANKKPAAKIYSYDAYKQLKSKRLKNEFAEELYAYELKPPIDIKQTLLGFTGISLAMFTLWSYHFIIVIFALLIGIYLMTKESKLLAVTTIGLVILSLYLNQ